MSRLNKSYALVLGILSACGSAYADRVPIQAHEAPYGSYSVNLVDESGRTLPTFRHRGRFYVLGNEGMRYSVRVTNSTARRVEAVISIDGLDAVDGKSGSLGKRGYIVPAYGSLQVDGFRVSMDDVATFRFSNVPNSYAGRKGQARNVGVVGVAIYSERYEEPVYIPQPEPDYTYDYEDEAPGSRAGAADRAPSPSPPPAASPPASGEASGSRAGAVAPRPCYGCDRPESSPHRPGLGTEFGERRGSRVSFVSFVRANARPDTVVEIRYNDRDGLIALGIPIARPYAGDDLHLRETANPFPRPGYAAPPPGLE